MNTKKQDFLKSFLNHTVGKSIEQNFINSYNKLLEDNIDIDITVIKDNIFEYMNLKDDYQLKIIILEAFFLLVKIQQSGITENSYTTDEAKYENAISNIKVLTAQMCNLKMLPRPSKVIYYLKYFLYNFFKLEKNTVKSIVDIVANKEDTFSSRMPRINKELDLLICNTLEHQSYLFNNTDGIGKFKYFGTSIFITKELHSFKNLIYPQ